MYDEPNINNFFPEIDHDALAKYMEQHAHTEQITSDNQPLPSFCGVHGQNPDPKLVEYQLPEKPVIQDEFSFIPDSTVTDVLNNPVFESQSATKEVVHLNLEDTTNGSTTTFSPDDEIRKRLENLSDKQKELIEKTIKQTGDWGSATDLAIKLMTNAPTGASAITKFDTETTTGIYMNESNGININSGPSLEMNAVTRGGQGTGQPTTKPSTRTIIAKKIQEILDMLFVSAEDENLDYYLRHALEIAQGQKVDYTTNQPRYWRFIGETKDIIGNNAVLISANGSDHKLLLCYHQRVLFMVDNKLIRLVNPESYSKTVWKYVHKCIDRHDYFWVYDKNIRRMSHKERKRILTQFYNHDNYKNGFF